MISPETEGAEVAPNEINLGGNDFETSPLVFNAIDLPRTCWNTLFMLHSSLMNTVSLASPLFLTFEAIMSLSLKDAEIYPLLFAPRSVTDQYGHLAHWIRDCRSLQTHSFRLAQCLWAEAQLVCRSPPMCRSQRGLQRSRGHDPAMRQPGFSG